ncbi:uncharacterized protein BDW47DRAFT_112399 [Aspergillus candidus]|uniref:Uncharacterized protein n=1 Tax=Aspergillus candidus TaxID=41067 RepID=A0A2I2F126_ASPCN|nr:hypothetical protein BDW47DRAFT_112399 [Aspergillus candidus]PLB34317.1 hypothetical protein BDW47DRAFT_112399 [Aspergillus candidus]
MSGPGVLAGRERCQRSRCWASSLCFPRLSLSFFLFLLPPYCFFILFYWVCVFAFLVTVPDHLTVQISRRTHREGPSTVGKLGVRADGGNDWA